ncbi:hypothetical protein FRC03_007236 [Tulasnella sp. 419]|nr:hypothetical protein FRC03_007236 [Tulasnella sp. 419]
MGSFIPSLQTFAKGSASFLAGTAALGVGLLYYGQNYMIYPSGFPPGSRTNIATPLEYNMIYQDLTLETSDGLKLKAYLMLQRREVPVVTGVYRQQHQFVPPKVDGQSRDITVDEEMDEEDQQIASSRPTVIIFHANAGNLGHRLPLARLFYEQMRCNVVMLSYRGYGMSEGSPSEAGLRIDAQTTLDFVRDHPLMRSTKIILYGQSIGGAVSIDLASQNPQVIHALILENTFLSIPQLIPSVVPYLSPVSFLCHQNWNSSESLTKIPSETPMLMLSGLQDEVVPPLHMKRLWEIATESIKESEIELFESEEPELAELHARRAGNPTSAEDNPQASKEKAGSLGYRKLRRGSRWWMEFPFGKHNDTCTYRQYWVEVSQFIRQFDKIE